MLRTFRRAVTLASVAAAVTVTPVGGATADDTTCTIAIAAVTPPSGDVLVGRVYGVATAQADAFCENPAGGNEWATLSVWIEYQPYYGAAFVPVSGCDGSSATEPARAGLHVLATRAVSCLYGPGNPASGRPHRAHATVTLSQRTYHAHSPVLAT